MLIKIYTPKIAPFFKTGTQLVVLLVIIVTAIVAELVVLNQVATVQDLSMC